MKLVLQDIGVVFDSLRELPKLVAFLLFVAMFTVYYYMMFKFLSENGATPLAAVFSTVLIVFGVVTILQSPYRDTQSTFVFLPLLFIVVIALIFSVELKRLIWRNSSAKLLGGKHPARNLDEAEVGVCIDEIIRAVQNMSKNDIGAIIVLASTNMPENIMQSGVKIESDITSQLIESIFFPKTPLHDGAMIISGTKIVAAGCFLPLSQKENLPKELGTRHRAGIGITEVIDVTTIIVSEETGIISIVKEGKITRYADSEALRRTLSKFYWQDLAN